MGDLLSLSVVAWVGLAWLTHVVTCISSAKWILLLIGTIVFPVGCIHGTCVWFGMF